MPECSAGARPFSSADDSGYLLLPGRQRADISAWKRAGGSFSFRDRCGSRSGGLRNSASVSPRFFIDDSFSLHWMHHPFCGRISLSKSLIRDSERGKTPGMSGSCPYVLCVVWPVPRTSAAGDLCRAFRPSSGLSVPVYRNPGLFCYRSCSCQQFGSPAGNGSLWKVACRQQDGSAFSDRDCASSGSCDFALPV